MRLIPGTLALLLPLGLAGCPGPAVSVDGGADALAAHDVGTALDANVVIDTGNAMDMGSVIDTGSTSDVGTDASTAVIAGTIVPLYTDPSDATWPAIVAAANAHPSAVVVAIVNPNDGPTAHVDPAYTTGIAALHAAHIVVIGYVATGYGTRAEAEVNADVDLYVAQYPTLDGIFFDEAAIYETGHETRYTAEASHARGAGMDFLVANPGTTPDAAYDDLFDVAMVYETDGAPAETDLAEFAPRRTHCGIIPYAVDALDTAYVASIRPDVEYVYLTDDDLPNPWDTLPPYFDALLAALE